MDCHFKLCEESLASSIAIPYGFFTPLRSVRNDNKDRSFVNKKKWLFEPPSIFSKKTRLFFSIFGTAFFDYLAISTDVNFRLVGVVGFN